jgi:hypothetical protein
MKETQNILNRLTAADRAHQREAGGRLLLRSVKYVCGFILAAFAVDVALHLSSGWRLGLLLALGVVAFGLGVAAWYLAFVRRNRLEHIARFLEARDPALGSRLINLLQLQSQTDDPTLAPLTRDLAQQAVETYAADLRPVPLERLAHTGEVARHLKRAAGAALGFAAVCAVFFRVVPIEFARFTDPYGDHPPYSFTRLEIVDPGAAGTNVLYGRGFVVRVKSGGHLPKEVFLTAFPTNHPEQAITQAMFDKGGGAFDQLVDNVRTGLVVFAHTKDLASRSKQARIDVVLTPQLDKAFVRIAPPAYTGLKAEEKPYAFKAVQALAGSEVKFRLLSNRPLREGRLEITIADEPPRQLVLTPTAENEVSGSFIASQSCRLRFSLTDIAGLPSQEDWQGSLTATHDLLPEIRVTEPERDCFVAMDFKLKAQFEASDDYGLRTVRIHRGLNGVYSTPKAVNYDAIIRDSHESEDFDIAQLGVEPGDVISLFAEAIDTAPEPHLARSGTVRLTVVSVEDYNNFLREQTDLADTEAKYEELMDKLKELIEEQKKLGAEAEQLKEQTAKSDAKQSDELTQRLDALLAKQNELNEKLNQQAGRMAKFVRDDPVYDVEKELQKTLQEQAARIRQSTDTNNAAARDLAQQSSPPGSPRQLKPGMLDDFKRESDAQVARLGGVEKEAQKQLAETLQDMSKMQELQKDFAQFEALYETQQELARLAEAYNRPGELSREDQLALKELAATQREVGALLKLLTEKLQDDAEAAEKLFPKAAQSGRDLAGKISEMRLAPLADQATDRMLAGNGQQSFQTADRIRSEMEKLFGQCKGGNCPGSDELDSYLKLNRGMNPKNNFAQMARSRKFGRANSPGSSQAQGSAQGEGTSGSSGYAVRASSSLNVMGNEMRASRSSATARQSNPLGAGAGTPTTTLSRNDPDKSDTMKNLNPVNRQTGNVTTEAGLDEYQDVVESYFKAITAPKPSKGNTP